MRQMRSVPNTNYQIYIAAAVIILILAAAVYFYPRIAEGFSGSCPDNCLKCTTVPGYLEANGVECDSCSKSCPTQHAAVGAAGPTAGPRESEMGY